jgi:hypothetical protein
MTVNIGAATKLQILLPGEIAAPGTATGKTGTAATTQIAGDSYRQWDRPLTRWTPIGTS